MREIKFRAWYEKEKRFLSWGELQDGTESLQTYFNNELSDVSPLMQYTGLKDKNGKEIYEGDIVRCYGGAYLNGIYEYNYVIEVRDIRDLNEIVHSENVEILGNKYENPELLECEE